MHFDNSMIPTFCEILLNISKHEKALDCKHVNVDGHWNVQMDLKCKCKIHHKNSSCTADLSNPSGRHTPTWAKNSCMPFSGSIVTDTSSSSTSGPMPCISHINMSMAGSCKIWQSRCTKKCSTNSTTCTHTFQICQSVPHLLGLDCFSLQLYQHQIFASYWSFNYCLTDTPISLKYISSMFVNSYYGVSLSTRQ